MKRSMHGCTFLIGGLLAGMMLAGCSGAPVVPPGAPAKDSASVPVSAPSPQPLASPNVVESSPRPGLLSETTCSRDQDERLLTIFKKGNGCVLNYTKFSRTHEIASSAHGSRHCESVREKTKKNLQDAGFACN